MKLAIWCFPFTLTISSAWVIEVTPPFLTSIVMSYLFHVRAFVFSVFDWQILIHYVGVKHWTQERSGEWEEESQTSREPISSSPFYRGGGMGGFHYFPNGPCIYKKASRGYKWALSIISQGPSQCN
jgi:hypothetical protein